MSLIEAIKDYPIDPDYVLQLIRNGADVNETDAQGWNPLLWAAEIGHYEVLKVLLENGAKVNMVDDGWSPLMWAIDLAPINVIRLLLHNGASLEIRNNQNKRPVDIAKEYKRLKIVKVIEKEFPLWLRLYHAAHQGNYDECLALLEQKALHETSQNGLYCPMTAATKKGHTPIVKLLLEKGAKIIYKENDERNPLYLATKKGHTDIVTLLLDKGGNANVKIHGGTLLHVATRKNHEDLARHLLQTGLNPNLKDSEGLSPLHYSIINGNGDIVNQLIHYGADTNLATSKLETPLHLACKVGQQQIVEILVKNGANVDALNEESNTPMDIVNRKYFDTQEILDNINALLLPPETANPTPVAKGATSEGRTEIRRVSSEGKQDNSDEDSDSDATVEYPLSTFISMKPEFSSRVLDTTAIEELNTKIAELSALVLELNEKRVNLEITESDFALERYTLKHLNLKMENTRVLKRLKGKDLKYEDDLQQLTRTVFESKRKHDELKEEVKKFQSEIPLIKTRFKDVYREITRILNEIEVVFICQ